MSDDVQERSRLLIADAWTQLNRGHKATAMELCRAALAQDSACFPAHQLLATLTLEGEPYRSLLERIHRHLGPRTYLEIGVAGGETAALAHASTLVMGVDPAPRIEAPLPPNVRIVNETSDRFFAQYDVIKEFGGLPLDLAFIDGMHLFEYALRDFINIERVGARETRVLVHDCYPLDETSAARERVSLFWTGDVWKLVICLKKYRADLQIHTLASPLSGLAVIRRLDPSSTLLRDNLADICREFVALPLLSIQSDMRGALNLLPGDWDTARRLIE